jgi:cytochrome c-type biogenesis protein CcmH/NrfG
MAKIALRVYNNEINDLIDHGQIEEAIAHCRHILETYPKHVDTYRLLGKSYLEEQRYGDAGDILQRVLSSIPEDFISQVGMSIIREDEGNLDTAIFHMERAFEVQPSNHAIQDELKRLYGRRDGIEPPKIRLTRGALARMYAHGNLYDLAIAELLAALSEDPQRYDLMVLLAKMYFQADKKIEAAETCTKILEKLPYCLEANRLLTNILESSNRQADAKGYKSRWEELDPYAVALDEGQTDTEFVPNQTITVERMEWEPGTYEDEAFERPAWASSLGVDIQGEGDQGEALPDWMSQKEEQPDPASSLFEDTPESAESPPLWASATDGVPEDLGLGVTPDASDFAETPSSSEEPLEESFFPPEQGEEETPEWMRTSEDEALALSEETTQEEVEDTPEWMSTPLESDQPQEDSLFPTESEEDSTPEWMAAPKDEAPEQTFEADDASEAIPDFMKEAGWESGSGEEEKPIPAFSDAPMDNEDEEIAEGDIPEWMQDLAPTEDEALEPTPFIQEETSFTAEAESEGTPDDQLPAESDALSETPAWLSEVESQEDVEVPDEIEEPMLASEPPEDKSDEPTPEPADEEGMAWLESLAAKQGVAEEELVTSPEERSETPPDWPQETTTQDEPQPESEEEPSMDWLDQLSQEAAEEAAPEGLAGEPTTDESLDILKPEEVEPQPEVEEVTPVPETLDEVPAPSVEEEDGLGWLESLAAKQGVAEEELVTSPEERSETPPDWPQETTAEDESQPESEEEPSMDWLDQLSQEAAEEAAPESLVGDQMADELLDFLKTEEAEPQPEVEEAAPVPETLDEPLPPSAEEEDGLGWLESLAAKQGVAEEELVTSPEERSETPPDWLQETTTKDEPQPEGEEEPSLDWLDQVGQEAVGEADPSPEIVATSDDEAETWLRSLEQPQADSTSPVSEPVEEEEDLAWLESLTEKPSIDEEKPEPSPEEDIQDETVTDAKAEQPPEWILPEEKEAVKDSAEDEPSTEWLDELSQEHVSEVEEEVKVSTDWLHDMSDIEDDLETEEELGSTPDAIDKVDEWFESLDQEETVEVDTAQTEDEQPIVEPDAETVASTVSEEEITIEPDIEPAASQIMEEEAISELEPETEEEEAVTESEPETEEPASPIIPEWLQDVADQKPDPDAIEEPPEWLPEVEEPEVEVPVVEEPKMDESVAATQPSEWQPEAEIQAQPVEETQPSPLPKPPPEDASEKLEEARQAISEKNLEEAINIYANLIKRGKVIDETIEDIQEALRKHPINASLWQVLGDALMRSDRLQEALDAYSKAEDLLR